MPDWISTFPGYGQLQTSVKRMFGKIIQTGPTPKHIGFVMDGNRRFARKNHIELKEGHNAGFESMAQLLELCYECGVEAVTVFAFSVENFKRSEYEVNWLMELAKSRFVQLCEHGELAAKFGVRIKVLGEVGMLPDDVLEVLRRAEDMTKDNKRATLNVCFPYTSRYDMTHSITKTIKSVQEGDINVEDIDIDVIDHNLYTGESPPLDLLIRTSGTYRLSDFLLWQVVSPGVVIEFLDVLWPDFGPFRMAWVLLKWSYIKSFGKSSFIDEDSKKND